MDAEMVTTQANDTLSWRTDRLVRRWYWIALGGLAGAALALILSTTRTPVYQASAALDVGVDYPRTLPIDLLAENRILNRVASFLTSDEMMASIMARLEEEKGPGEAWSSPEELRSRLRLDRKAATWELVGMAESPAEATLLAGTWLEVSVSALDQALSHAWESLRIQSPGLMLVCSELATGEPEEFFWECLAAGPSLSAEEVAQLREQLELSQGILPIVSYHVRRAAIADPSPIMWGRGPLVAGGALVGLALGTLLAALVPPRRAAGVP